MFSIKLLPKKALVKVKYKENIIGIFEKKDWPLMSGDKKHVLVFRTTCSD